MGNEMGFLDLGRPQVIFVVLLSLLLPLSIFVDSIAGKLHVQHLHHWWTVVAQALNAPAKRAELTRLEAAE